MALDTREFKGADFFASIRSDMAKDRGFYAGKDVSLVYACMDATFYRLQIFKKADDVKFSEAAKGANGARVVVNGQWVNSEENFLTRYCLFPCSDKPWDGEIVVDGTVDRPVHKIYDARYWHFGQRAGRSAASFIVGKGPALGTSTAVGKLRDGLGPLTGVIADKKVCTQLKVWDADQGLGRGMPIYGVHRASDTVFVLVQQDEPIYPMSAVAIAQRLVDMGVDAAAMGDGSNSVTLVVDHVVEIQPHRFKDNTMRVGPMFSLQTLKTNVTAATMKAASDSTDSKFPPGTVLTGVDAEFTQTMSGMQLDVSLMGASGTRKAPQIMQDLGLSSPTKLTCPSSRLSGSTEASSAEFKATNTTARLRLPPVPVGGGTIVGTVTIKTSRGDAKFDASWPLTL